MQWTKELPQKSGYYWFYGQYRKVDKPPFCILVVVEIAPGGHVWINSIKQLKDGGHLMLASEIEGGLVFCRTTTFA